MRSNLLNPQFIRRAQKPPIRKRIGGDVYLLLYLLKGANVIDECGKDSEGEIDLLLDERESCRESRTAGCGAYSVVAVINVDHRFLERNELIIVSRLGKLLGGKVTAVEAEGLIGAECCESVTVKIGNRYLTCVNVSAVFLRSYVMLEILACRGMIYSKL